MKILFLGGKRFAGYHMVNAALARGHEVVLFNRGRTSPELFSELRTINGDRTTDLTRLGSERFDAVIDTSAYIPEHMRVAAEFFSDKTDRYLFISSVSVYDTSQPGVHEGTVTVPPIFEDGLVTNESYGGMKAACEVLARDVFGDRLTVLRPGYICGYRDGTDRMSYWPIKMHYQDKVIVPEGDFDFQIVDAEDLADFALLLIEKGIGGDFNVTGPGQAMKFSYFLDECRRVANPACEMLRISLDKITELGLDKPSRFANFPLFSWGGGAFEGIYAVDVRKAIAAGLTFRPVCHTIRRALDWHLETAQNEDDVAAGLKVSREREIAAQL